MKAIVQRVTKATVIVENPSYKASIGTGLCVFLGVEKGDQESQATWMANKLANLRIFRDEQGKMNSSLNDNNGELLLISQFTLAGDCSKGNRPSFINAADPEIAEPMVSHVGELLKTVHEIPVQTGVFGAMMQIELINDGPVTLIVERG
jgi:D-tyrosyl-tRNA(Tyr) deacylase